MAQLFTIGYEQAQLDVFIETLKLSGVRRIIDIRELPVSRRKGFSKSPLRQSLTEHGIEYYHFKELGDPKAGREAARAGRLQEFRDIFTLHLQRPPAQDALNAVASLALDAPSCLLCYEKDHRHCHRSLVARALSMHHRLSVENLSAD